MTESKLQFLRKGRKLHCMGNFDLALELYKNGLDSFPEDKHILYETAYCYFRLGHVVKAKEILGTISKDFPKNCNLLCDIAECYLTLGEFIEAFKLLGQISKSKNRSVKLMLKIACMLDRYQLYEQASVYLQTAKEINPEYVGVYIEEGFHLDQSAKFGEGLSSFQHAVEIAPNDYKARIILGQAYFFNSRDADGVLWLFSVPIEKFIDCCPVKLVVDYLRTHPKHHRHKELALWKKKLFELHKNRKKPNCTDRLLKELDIANGDWHYCDEPLEL